MPTPQRIQITPENLVKWTRVVSIHDLKPHPRNPRIGNVERIQTSLGKHGQFRAIIVSSDLYVLAGNHTYQAAMAEGQQNLAVHVLPLLHDAAQAIEILLADNHAGDDSEYDNTLLFEAIRAVEEEYETILATTYTEDEYAKLMAQYEAQLKQTDEKPDPDDVAAPPQVARTLPGDVWQLGPHRLICGDATVIGAYEELLGDERIDLVFTDPPYGVDVNGSDKNQVKRRKDGKTVVGDKLDGDELQDLLAGSFALASGACRNGAAWYVCAPQGNLCYLFAFELAKLDLLRQTLIWDKGSLVQGRSDYQYQHEPILYGWLGDKHQRVEDRTQTSVWKIAKASKSPMHPTIKPVELVLRALQNSSKPSSLVLDPFAGSGTTLIACHLSRRVARLIELDPIYCDVICRRWQEQTGQKPVLRSTGEAVDFIAETAEAAA